VSCLSHSSVFVTSPPAAAAPPACSWRRWIFPIASPFLLQLSLQSPFFPSPNGTPPHLFPPSQCRFPMQFLFPPPARIPIHSRPSVCPYRLLTSIRAMTPILVAVWIGSPKPSRLILMVLGLHGPMFSLLPFPLLSKSGTSALSVKLSPLTRLVVPPLSSFRRSKISWTLSQSPLFPPPSSERY